MMWYFVFSSYVIYPIEIGGVMREGVTPQHTLYAAFDWMVEGLSHGVIMDRATELLGRIPLITSVKSSSYIRSSLHRLKIR